MLNKIFFFIFLFSVSAYYTSGQTIKFSDPEFNFDGYENVKIIGQDAEGLFLLQSNLSLNIFTDRVGFKNRKYKLAYFTKNLKSVWNKKILPPARNMEVEHITFFNKKVLNVYKNLYGGDIILNLQWNNTKLPDVEQDTKQITFDLGKSSGYSKSRSIISKNKKRIAFVFTENNNDNEQILHYAILNTELETIKLSKHKIADKENRLALIEIVLSNQGDLMFLADYLKKKNKSEYDRSESFQLLTISAENTSLQKKIIAIEKKYLVKPSIRFDPVNNKGVLVSIFYNPELISESGILYTKINLTNNEFENEVRVPLDDNLHVKLISNEYINDIRGLSDYKIHEIILRNDGGSVIIAEAAYENEYSYYDYFTQSYTRRVEYYYANIFVASINANGTIDWNKIIKKSQYSRDDGGIYSSFIPMITSQEILMILNSELNKSNEVMAYGLSNSGKEFEKQLLEPIEHLLLIPSAGKQISSSSIVIPVVVKRKLALAKFEF